MPELPEVETVLRTLEPQLYGRRIEGIEIRYAKTVVSDPDVFCGRLIGESFRGFERRGKYLLFRMDHVSLAVHLRMEGKFFLQQADQPCDRHTHVIFTLDDGRSLRYHDTRKFGRMELFDADQDFSRFRNLGPEPFAEAFSANYIHQWRRGRKLPLKSMLLDQSFVAGIGNIYADEILAACGLRPGRSCARITRRDEENLVRETRRILRAAIAAGGTTIRSYTSSLGVTGSFQYECTVHMQKVCPRCGQNIRMKYIGGRSSYYCPVCQKS